MITEFDFVGWRKAHPECLVVIEVRDFGLALLHTYDANDRHVNAQLIGTCQLHLHLCNDTVRKQLDPADGRKDRYEATDPTTPTDIWVVWPQQHVCRSRGSADACAADANIGQPERHHSYVRHYVLADDAPTGEQR